MYLRYVYSLVIHLLHSNVCIKKQCEGYSHSSKKEQTIHVNSVCNNLIMCSFIFPPIITQFWAATVRKKCTADVFGRLKRPKVQGNDVQGE